MGRKAIDRTGEERINSFGSKIVIKEYRKWNDNGCRRFSK